MSEKSLDLAGKEFREWAALFSGDLFVKIVAYIDESGTHDKTGKEPGSSVAVIVGLADQPEAWTEFCKEWQSVLNKYSAPYFHFSEFNSASLVLRGKAKAGRRFSQNPYSTWKLDRLNRFLFELAELAGGGDKVLVGGWIETANIHKAKSVGPASGLVIPVSDVPYEWLLSNFFHRLPADILSGRPEWIGTLAIFFDWNTDPEWGKAVTGCFQFWKRQDSRFSELAFVDKKLPPHLPLQAADLVAYRYRQLAENYLNNQTVSSRQLSSLSYR